MTSLIRNTHLFPSCSLNSTDIFFAASIIIVSAQTWALDNSASTLIPAIIISALVSISAATEESGTTNNRAQSLDGYLYGVIGISIVIIEYLLFISIASIGSISSCNSAGYLSINY